MVNDLSRLIDPLAILMQPRSMRFLSDNSASASPEVLAAIASANLPDVGYDGDALSCRLDAAFSQLFETEVAALWVTTGTAANSLALATMCPPYGGIVCHEDAHISTDEAGAPEFYTHGAKLITLAGEGAKIDPQAIEARLSLIRNDVHRVQPHAISITNATEMGLVYTPEETAAIGAFARANRLAFHLDGARFANAVAHLGCHPADLSWRAGVEMMSFGFIKNGGMNAEAIICFQPEKAQEIRIRRKRGGHLSSKGRYQAAQILALLENDLWLANARKSNGGAQRIAAAAGRRLLYPVEANELFVRLSPSEAATLRAKGFAFYDWGAGLARLVVSWDQPESEISAAAEAIRAL
jgi:threonine aldolase